MIGHPHLFKEQSRTVELVFGTLALVAGAFGVALCLWLLVRDGRAEPRDVPIFVAGIAIGVYSLVVARRLLRSPADRAPELLSPVALIMMGLWMVLAATIPWLLAGQRFWFELDMALLGVAAMGLGWHRLRARVKL